MGLRPRTRRVADLGKRVRSNKKGVWGKSELMSELDAPSPSLSGRREAPDEAEAPFPQPAADARPRSPQTSLALAVGRGKLRRFARLRRPRRWRWYWDDRLVTAVTRCGSLVGALELLNIDTERGLALLQLQPELMRRVEDARVRLHPEFVREEMALRGLEGVEGPREEP